VCNSIAADFYVKMIPATCLEKRTIEEHDKTEVEAIEMVSKIGIWAAEGQMSVVLAIEVRTAHVPNAE
jgi:hypothetical protein